MQGSTALLRAIALFLTLLASWPSAAPAQAQLRIPSEALVPGGELQQLFEKGARLERERRWGEALSHYEDALKVHPGRQDIAERLTWARIHLDVARRYCDTSFAETLRALSEQQAMDVYSEVLLKIDTYYVQTPTWGDVVRRGANYLGAALTEPAFQQRNGIGASPEQIETLRRELVQQLDSFVVSNRHQACEAAALAARCAARRLSAPPQAVILEYACGAVSALDEYSGFLTGEQLDDIFSQIEGSFVGLGVELKSDAQSLLIVNVISGGPGQEGGLRSGDRIVAVDGRSTRDMTTDAAANLLKGPAGARVDLDVVTPSGLVRRLSLVRRLVEVPSVEDARIIDSQYGVAYVRLASFQKTTIRDVDAALWRLYREGMKSLVVDVRGNPGGLLSASVDVTDRFVSSGAIVATRGRNSHEDFDYPAHAAGTWRVPLIVLIDGDTASASEIFASAIRDHRRGVLVGQRSYGKGSVQGIFPLDHARAGVRLTTAKFYSPNGAPISRHGVSPDVIVHQAAKPTTPVSHPGEDGREDAVLQAALQLARNLP